VKTVKIQVGVYWVMTPCGVVIGYQSFRGSCCLLFPHKEV